MFYTTNNQTFVAGRKNPVLLSLLLPLLAKWWCGRITG